MEAQNSQEKPKKEFTKETILVVDDEKDIQAFIKFKLQKIGYNVVTAPNGYEAIEKLKKFRPDLVLLDIRMPVMDGFKTCDYIKNHKDYKYIPVIFVSILNDIKDKATAYKYGADDYITKPIDIITLAARVKSILEVQRLKDRFRRELDKKAITDNLFDYQHLFERLETELTKCRKNQKPLSIIYLDVDYMKFVNMKYGAKVGDLVARQVRETIINELWDAGIILFSNSDKVFMVLPNTDEKKVKLLADNLLKKVKMIAPPFDSIITSSVTITEITTSMGIVTWDKIEGVSSEKLLKLVETALKDAKDQGRGRNVQYELYSKPLKDGTHVIDQKK